MLGGSEGMVLVVVILLLFGGSQIPKLARNLGLAQKELKNALHGDDEPADASSDATADTNG
ncbi:twin-arginine translocase TatA/TatE family subunit [Ilumatobacter coccineus]|jgi:sec-independent protein translocase protein TatA|uniref:Sec-independent protein translocase protein TatA n=1 Tax=Ilumatobacter coccineus (strain NBRC 103263 / KCTC 29153 / YM16-304) TaxID=1313172 RepID=A0A6C7E8Y4_ILUCY|nr:twin-arginine translocase TatA/TatE family subunit [Ilumatobacter coccineus]BAN01058.1 Sec-independent protein translocase protein TatA [Ilumatobacter coccineus YM16-304]